jgi:predicted outer membrane repeat protein
LSGNRADAGSSDRGGGIFVTTFNNGVTTIRDSTLSDNHTKLQGGGIWARTVAGGTLMIQNSTLSGNSANGSASHGGGIFSVNYGAASIENSTFFGNSAVYGGGGIQGQRILTS